ncbi:MAG: class I adenylate-forming enzyme family protein [Anaerovoracaceae bacterium]
MESLVQIITEISMKRPEHVALVSEGRSLSYGELADRICSFARALKRNGVKKGQRIMLETCDIPSFYTAFLGCQLAGCIAVPFETRMTAHKLDAFIASIKPSLIFSGNYGESYEAYFEADGSTRRLPMPKAESEAVIVSTTGTTGQPSFVIHSNRSLVSEVENLSEGTDIKEDTVLFCNYSSHLAAGYRRVFAALTKGATAVAAEGPLEMTGLKQMIKDYGINHLSLVNSDIRRLAEAAAEDESFTLPGIRTAESATSTLYYDTILSFHNHFPHITLYNVYGTTESGCLLINDTSDNLKDGCIGKPACNARISVVDENLNPIATPGKYGYPAVSGDMNMLGYYRKKALTRKVLQGDKVIINDIVYFDEDGYFYFVSRVGDVICAGDSKIIPSEIELAAMRFGGIRECACVAGNDKVLGEVPVLFIVCENRDEFDFTGFKAFLDDNLESYRVPKSIIPIESMPCTSTGKIMRKHLSMMTEYRVRRE